LQSESAWQVIARQTLFVHVLVIPLHCEDIVHSTQRPEVVSQAGVMPPLRPAHSISVVQPWMQTWRPVSHTGRAVGQSVLARHATHVSVLVSHTAPAALPLQSAFAAHSAHCCVVGSQTGVRGLPLQSSAVMHPTHAKLVGSQMGVRPVQVRPASGSHAARHVLLLG
jgi:hypothetical protein